MDIFSANTIIPLCDGLDEMLLCHSLKINTNGFGKNGRISPSVLSHGLEQLGTNKEAFDTQNTCGKTLPPIDTFIRSERTLSV